MLIYFLNNYNIHLYDVNMLLYCGDGYKCRLCLNVIILNCDLSMDMGRWDIVPVFVKDTIVTYLCCNTTLFVW